MNIIARALKLKDDDGLKNPGYRVLYSNKVKYPGKICGSTRQGRQTLVYGVLVKPPSHQLTQRRQDHLPTIHRGIDMTSMIQLLSNFGQDV